MAKNPADRFATMEDFATAIWPERPVQAGQPTPTIAGFSPLAKLIARRKPRHRTLAAAAVVAAGLGVAFLVGRGTEREPGDLAESAASPAASLDSQSGVVPPVSSPVAAESVGLRTAPVDTASRDSLPTPSVPDSATPSPPPAREPPKRTRAVTPTPGARARATPQPPQPPAAEVGYLTVNTVPYGTVSIDGVEVGDTPIVRRRLPPGEHVVRITRPGFRPESATVTITAGNEVRFRRTLIEDGR
jgi:hypothetical protein